MSELQEFLARRHLHTLIFLLIVTSSLESIIDPRSFFKKVRPDVKASCKEETMGKETSKPDVKESAREARQVERSNESRKEMPIIAKQTMIRQTFQTFPMRLRQHLRLQKKCIIRPSFKETVDKKDEKKEQMKK